MVKRLTVRKIEQAKPDPKRRLEIPDAGKPGLYLIIQPSGKKSWAVRYRYAGRPRKLTLTGFPSLATARKLAQQALDKVAERQDPAAEKRAAKMADLDSKLFSAVAEQFVQRHVRAKTRPSSAHQTERWLAREVLPKWGNCRIQEITKRNVLDLLDGLADRGRGLSANRVLAVIRKLFNWAIERGIIETSPVFGVRAPAEERKRDRVLTDHEIRWLWKACDGLAYPFGDLAKMLLLTGQRRNEVAAMRWSELDLEKRVWLIPAERVKNGETHEVPLSEIALSILSAAPRINSGKEYVFTTNAETHVSGYSRAKAAIESAMLEQSRAERGTDFEIPRWTLHDFRRTAASGMARLGVHLPVIEKVLNHVSGSFAGVAGVYQRHHFANEKRAALDAWAKFVLALLEGQPANLVLLKAVRS